MYIIKSKIISPGNITFQVSHLSLSFPDSNRDRILQWKIVNIIKAEIGYTLVRVIITGNIVAGKNNGGYKYGGIVEKPPNLTRHCFTCK